MLGTREMFEVFQEFFQESRAEAEAAWSSPLGECISATPEGVGQTKEKVLGMEGIHLAEGLAGAKALG